jgi:4-alpha-glucanotransferase
MGLSHELSAIDPREQKINEPANPTHYWRYRLHVPFEDVTNKYVEFDDKLKSLVKASGR